MKYVAFIMFMLVYLGLIIWTSLWMENLKDEYSDSDEQDET